MSARWARRGVTLSAAIFSHACARWQRMRVRPGVAPADPGAMSARSCLIVALYWSDTASTSSTSLPALEDISAVSREAFRSRSPQKASQSSPSWRTMVAVRRISNFTIMAWGAGSLTPSTSTISHPFAPSCSSYTAARTSLPIRVKDSSVLMLALDSLAVLDCSSIHRTSSCARSCIFSRRFVILHECSALYSSSFSRKCSFCLAR
mmetsp:Transcript_24918/g.69482  ORF Transcript_24918/g.69482 Transcript_24918/m.69482 type:complete len:206 (-) Transcript_24918:1816-2433(-)